MFLPQEIIRSKRDGQTLAAEHIDPFIAGVTRGEVSDAQIAAFAMAVFLNGMSGEECVHLTRAMRDSGSTLDWKDLDRPVADKHSTGGVGDTVSLMLAPMLAACGVAVPMISGRGLGHTGGTLDKLEAIPGYDVRPELGRLRQVVRAVGCAIVGQTADLAPADRRIYSVRDVTATVESIPLIAASILSKKLAAGLGALVMDVKVGSGAFMPTRAMSRELARTIMRVGQGAGLPTQAILTDMNQALAPAAGNALEVRVALDYLRGDAQPERLNTVTLALGSEALLLSGVARDGADARARLSKALASGRALETFARMVSALGGPHDLAERPDLHLASAPVVRTVSSGTAGWIASIDTRALGMAVVAMGGGRARAEDHIDPRVGLANLLELGARVEPDTPIAMVHAASEDAAASAAARVRAAYRIGERSDRPVLLEKVTE